ncbi:MAG: hypothetical protein ACK46A_15095 [Akkermansiaceae bacterium]|jgi:hypothetical protein|nr:nucleotidyltransferase [Luteolibacter sp.]
MQAVCDTLEQLLQEGILTRYAIGGATAAGFHGEPLATRDVDVFVFLDPPTGSILVTLDPVFRRLNELGFNQFDEEGLLIHNLPVQFLSAAPGLESEAVEQAMIVEWESHTLRVMRPEHLAAIALSVGRPKDRARLVYLAELPDFNITVFQQILSRHQLLDRWHQWATALGLKL